MGADEGDASDLRGRAPKPEPRPEPIPLDYRGRASREKRDARPPGFLVGVMFVVGGIPAGIVIWYVLSVLLGLAGTNTASGLAVCVLLGLGLVWIISAAARRRPRQMPERLSAGQVAKGMAT